jgi:putative nucleotidyltransferase with HDIG domain
MPDTLDMKRLAGQVQALPPLPQAMAEVMLALGNQALSAQRSIALIESDPALAGRTLRLANSAFYGMAGRVASIGDAVRLLGLRTVASVLSAVALHGLLKLPACPGFDFEAYWRHAIATALAARALAPLAGVDADQAFLAGLMHDVGQLVLAAHLPVDAQATIDHARQAGQPLHQAEQALLGFSHAEVGAWVARHWHFPETIASAIECHHGLDLPPAGHAPGLPAVVQLASVLAGEVMSERQAVVPAAMRPLLQTLALDAPDQLAALLQTLARSTREMAELLGRH